MDLNGGINLKDGLLVRPEIKDYAETINALGNVSGSTTIDLTLGNTITATATNTVQWTFSNPSATGKACAFSLFLTNGGAYTQTWPSPNTKWASGTAPTLTTSGTDLIVFVTLDAGTTWNGIVSAKDLK